MKLNIAALIAASLALPLFWLSAPQTAFAQPRPDVITDHEFANVVARPEYATEFEGFRIYLAGQPAPIARVVERNVTNSLRTRRFGRSPEESCQWVMLSALMQMRDHARAVGGNGIANLRSNWDNVETSSSTQYKCVAGFLMAGVAIKGDVVRLR